MPRVTPLQFLIAESETAEQREARRRTAGSSSAETYADTLRSIAPASRCDIVRPHDSGPASALPNPLASYDAVFLSGSPMHVYADTPQTRRQLAFMRAVFAAGIPSFGSCAGLQVATAAAGGRVRKSPRHEIAFARRITATSEGRAHPLLRGRPAAWDALAIHSDAVEQLPSGATRLAGNEACPVQAAVIPYENGVFWGVQYHPELTIAEIGAALRRQIDDLLDQGIPRTEAEQHIALIDALGADPQRADLAWRLGLDAEITDPARRHLELANFIDAVIHRRVDGPLVVEALGSD